jgi:hypothetical protein
MKKVLLILLLVSIHFLLQAQCGSPSALFNNSISDNGNKGIMFDIEAQSGANVTINCFSPYLYLGTTATYMIFYHPGTFVGTETNPAAWTLIDSVMNVASLGNDVITPIPIAVNVTILAGQKAAFYITTSSITAGIDYKNSGNAANVGEVAASNSDIILRKGVGKTHLFSTTYTSRTFLGRIGYTPNVVFPLDLISFKGESKTTYNLLKWTTANEINTSHFEIEKSEDGEKFDKIGEVAAAGNNNGQLNYQFQDNTFSQGRNYYRLTCFDLDGKFTRSEIISLYNDKIEGVRVFPNPFSANLNIQIDNYEQPFAIYDAYAKLIQKGEMIPPNIDLSQLSAGIYFLKIGNQNIQIIKQ